MVIGSIFQGGYEILSEIGAGSFGRVYRARQLSTGQDVAIKVLRAFDGTTVATSLHPKERLRREMRLCAELSHPNIVRLIDSGESGDGRLYVVFEYVRGETLKDVLAEEGKLSLRETVHLMTQVLDALSCAHTLGVVHRDLKPENIMVTRTGARRNALVLDFGLGGLSKEVKDWQLPRITTTQEMMGTPCYAAPEQLRGEPPSTRSDIYSWGLILLECLTGVIAVSGASAQEVVLRQLGSEPIPIPAWLRNRRLGRLLETVTAKQVEKRDVTIEGLLETLGSVDAREAETPSEPAAVRELPEGERRQLTIVSCRLVVSAPDGHALDPEELDEVLHAQHAVCAELAARSGGQIASVLADRVLLVFGYPQAHEDDARRAARTALAIVGEAKRTNARLETERRLRVDLRIGIHTGLVVARELRHSSGNRLYDLVGLAPQIATRIEDRAGSGEVLASLDTQRLLRNEIRCESAGELQVRELALTISVFHLSGERRAAGLETIASVSETPLIGRARQLEQLLESWARAQTAKGGVVLIGGEPGIGKSRLLRELRRRVPADSWLECRCVPENRDSPLRPILDLLVTVDESIESLLTRHGFDLGGSLPLFAALLSMPPDDRFAPLKLSPDLQKERTLNALMSLLLRMGERRPLVLAIEDLQWADPTTLELCALLVQGVRSSQMFDDGSEAVPRICVVFTARPEFSPAWSSEDMLLIQLPRLSQDEVEEMISAGWVMDSPLPSVVLDQVVRRSDGVPLFVEEVTRVLLESLTNVEIPSSLRNLLAARLDVLSPGARETAQLAAILGREFRYELLRAVSHRHEAVLREDLRDLTDSGLVYRRHSARSESYVFKHALVREAAYESMMKSSRQIIHRRVAHTLEQRFPEIERERPEILAQHFEHGGQPERAVTYRHRAGERALRRAAYIEAINQVETGLALLAPLPPSAERSRQEIELLTTLGTAFFVTKGFGVEEVERTFARARELCEELGEDIPLKVLHGIWNVHFVRSDREATAALVPRFRRLAERSDDPVSAIAGHSVLGIYAFARSEFVAARDHFARARQFYWTEEFQAWAREYGYDGGLFSYVYGMYSLWHLGYPDQAKQLSDELISTTEKVGDPHSIAIGLASAATLAEQLGDSRTAIEMSDRLAVLSTEQRFYLWLAGAMCVRGGALLQQGETSDAIAQIRQGLDLYRAIGVLYSYSYFLTHLAAAYHQGGKADEGLAAVDEALALCQTLLIRMHEPELLRLRGELLLLKGDVRAAEAELGRAIELAHGRSARSLELRAVTSLSRLFRDRGDRKQAQRLLAPVYDRFTEGFGTRDLLEAKAILTELSCS